MVPMRIIQLESLQQTPEQAKELGWAVWPGMIPQGVIHIGDHDFQAIGGRWEVAALADHKDGAPELRFMLAVCEPSLLAAAQAAAAAAQARAQGKPGLVRAAGPIPAPAFLRINGDG